MILCQNAKVKGFIGLHGRRPRSRPIFFSTDCEIGSLHVCILVER